MVIIAILPTMITITMDDTTNNSGKCFYCPQVELNVPRAEYLKNGSYLPWYQDTSDLESGEEGEDPNSELYSLVPPDVATLLFQC
jgi:hypothetical protein